LNDTMVARITTLILSVVAVLVAAIFLSAGRPTAVAPPTSEVPADPSTVYDPIVAGEEFPGGLRWPISRDGIRPVYDPTFVAASTAGWSDEDLVIGFEIDGDVRAYPVGYLNRREMVNDVVGGTPVLVSW
jgi:hypothetical protein